MRHVRPLLIAMLALTVLGWQGHDARATHDGTGFHIGAVSIDVGPAGVANDVEGNGSPATGDRSGDGVADAEGYDTPDPADAPGACDNGIDDDQADTDGDTVPGPGGFDGIPDDGCKVTLSPRETCLEIDDDDVLNADEDSLLSGQDRASIDITVGSHFGPFQGVPESRPLASWQYSLNWDVDVIDVALQDPHFLILSSGGGQPFVNTDSGLPDTTSPFTAAVSDAGPGDTGVGVVSRVTVEGNAPGMASLSLSGVVMNDTSGNPITVDGLAGVKVAVSKDGPDAGTAIGDSIGELFRCKIDQASIDLGPPGVANGVEDNGKAAVGDRDADTVIDAEGYDTSDPGDLPGICGNGLDDDQADTDFDGTPGPGGFDGVADDGCVITLTPRETCAEIIDDGVLNADEDSVFSGQDRLSIDVTIGMQPGPGGGVPDNREMSEWAFDLDWSPDVLDVDFHNWNFLILAAGGGQPFALIVYPLPTTTPYHHINVGDSGPAESGPGVLARITIEGNKAGLASLILLYMDINDYESDIPIGILNGAQAAVSKDGPDSGTAIGNSLGEIFHCPGPNNPDDDGDGVYDIDEQNCGGDPLNTARRPERLDTPGDDNGDTVVNEPLPAGSEGFDCDGDGWPGSNEMGIYAAAGTANDQDPCGNTGWPSDLVGSNNSLNIADINSFLIPLRPDGTYDKFGHPVPDPADPNIARWNLRQPPNAVIDIGDLNRLNPAVNTTMARPPMFGGHQAFFTNGGACPYAP